MNYRKGIELIQKYEGCRLKAYKALPTEKYYTIGWGHYGADVGANMTITQTQADSMLVNDLAKYRANVEKYDSTYHWTDNEASALLSFAYNVGSIDQLVAKGSRSKNEIAQKFLSYNKSGGKVIAGLTKRRKEEQELFLKNGSDIADGLYPILKKGSKGNYVVAWQNYLNGLGYNCGKVDGIFGNKTLEAVTAYQCDRNLVPDGIIDDDDWNTVNLV